MTANAVKLTEAQIMALEFASKLSCGESRNFFADFGHHPNTLHALLLRGLITATLVRRGHSVWSITDAGRAALQKVGG